MAKFCDIGARVRGEGSSGRAVADYLAGYGEALADRSGERRTEAAAED